MTWRFLSCTTSIELPSTEMRKSIFERMNAELHFEHVKFEMLTGHLSRDDVKANQVHGKDMDER